MKFLGLAVLALGAVALQGWLFMLTVGIIRGEWLAGLPTIGYGSAILVDARRTVPQVRLTHPHRRPVRHPRWAGLRCIQETTCPIRSASWPARLPPHTPSTRTTSRRASGASSPGGQLAARSRSSAALAVPGSFPRWPSLRTPPQVTAFSGRAANATPPGSPAEDP
ncbi:hypothetical protein [Micromonospora sp. WMMD1082]|uniref:hypothetical protein n=1 Tax=Micromonospora sp. WMMD1082 TaxID=3016104 RepID=UPI0024178806|nr:hypothetical protein [Micromonospora sp. WMMD1082]MDG4792687.1 hypothetical protein [Micromonospora sp. WMMD1082]